MTWLLAFVFHSPSNPSYQYILMRFRLNFRPKLGQFSTELTTFTDADDRLHEKVYQVGSIELSSYTSSVLPLIVDVLLGVIQLKRMVDRGALLHELDGTARVGRYVADGE
jgi:hypothetical protein